MLIVNGEDLSEYVKDEGESIEYEKIKGKHGGIVLSGTEVEETLAIKVSILYPCEVLTLAQFNKLASIFAEEVVSVTYFEPKILGQRTVNMKPQTLSGTKVLETGSEVFYDDVEIGFKEE